MQMKHCETKTEYFQLNEPSRNRNGNKSVLLLWEAKATKCHEKSKLEFHVAQFELFSLEENDL